MDPVEPTDPQQRPADSLGRPVDPQQPPVDQPVWAPPPAGAYYDWSHAYTAPDGATTSAPEWAPPPAATPRRRTGRIAVAAAAAAVLVGGGVGIGVAVTHNGTTSSAAGTTTTPDATNRQNHQFPGFGAGGTGGTGTGGAGTGTGGGGAGTGTGGTGSGSTGTSNSATSSATAAQSTGIVIIDTVLGYQNAAAAGTGMVISSDGTVLTNNHVVQGSTSIKVTVVSTGRTYTASVVGTDASDDVAVIKLTGASGLATVSTATTSNISTGTPIVAVGNAGGTGTLTAATGSVTATGQSITATDDSGANAEDLTGLLQTDAAIEAGDSGGPLYDSNGDVVGIDTAAATTRSGATAAGYAIPIAHAVTIAKTIIAGNGSSTITIGLPAFLGVSLASSTTTSSGAASDSAAATIAGVIAGLPAATAGIAAGDTITAIGGRAISSAADLSTALTSLSPGQQVSVSWTTAAGANQTATVTLVAGPAA